MIRTLTLAGLGIIATAAYVSVSQPTGPLPSIVGAANAQSSDATAAEAVKAEVTDFVMGDPDAPVTMIEYASFTCPHCKNFHLGSGKQIKADYIDTGKVKLIYREVFSTRPALWAGLVARCGGEERYFGIVELLYQRQSEWLDAADLAGIADNLRLIGRTGGLTDDEINACLTDQATAEAVIANFEKNMSEHDVKSTPSFVIGGEVYQNMALERMTELLDAELGE